MNVTVHPQTSEFPDTVIVPVAESNDLEKILLEISAVTHVPSEFLKSDFKANAKELFQFYYSYKGQSKRFLLLGMGENPRSIDVLNAFRALIFKRKKNLPTTFAISYGFGNAPENPSDWIEAAVNGIMLGLYDIGLYKTTEKEEGAIRPEEISLDILIQDGTENTAPSAARKGLSIAQTHVEIFNLVNAPSNKKTPEVLANWAVESGKKHGYSVQVFNKEKIEALGMEALLAVNRGSENPPTFIVMEYRPQGKALKKIGLVGKGVTFDTGGISIKPSTNMHYMKSDMGGAAAVMGTVEMAAKLKLPFHIMGVIPATDNSVDAKSVKPGDVIGSYLGKTIEVIDTDAEGRLILADGLAYCAKEFQPDVMIDLATLTGSTIRTLGTYAGGLFSNNDELSKHLLEAGEETGERLWRFPLWDDYKKELKSDVADVKNFSGNPSAGAITAAKFLEMFIVDHPAWAHLDIAGMAVADSEFSSQKSATGYGVRLLLNYFDKIAQNS